MAYRIPFNVPGLAGDELRHVADAITQGHTAGDGNYTAKCHTYLQDALAVPRVLLTTSCTHALAAFLPAQLERHQQIQAVRKRIWERYDEALRGWAAHHGIVCPHCAGALCPRLPHVLHSGAVTGGPPEAHRTPETARHSKRISLSAAPPLGNGPKFRRSPRPAHHSRASASDSGLRQVSQARDAQTEKLGVPRQQFADGVHGGSALSESSLTDSPASGAGPVVIMARPNPTLGFPSGPGAPLWEVPGRNTPISP